MEYKITSSSSVSQDYTYLLAHTLKWHEQPLCTSVFVRGCEKVVENCISILIAIPHAKTTQKNC